MKISVIIPTFNRIDILKSTYDALVIISNEINMEIIIVNDDGNTKPELIIQELNISHANTKVVNNTKKGAASARNLGASLSSGKLLIFIDDDIIVNCETLLSIIKLHAKYDRIILTPLWVYSPKMKNLLKKKPFGRYRLLYDYTAIRGESGHEFLNEEKIYHVDSLASFCLTIKSDHYKLLGGMDETFPYAGCEDQDFAMNAKEKNFTLLVDDSNIVLHNELDRLNRKNWMQRQFKGVQGYVLLAIKHPERRKVQLWYENTPIQLKDSFSLKIKKVMKCVFRQKLILACFNLSISILETMHIPDFILHRMYSMQSGIYINKGFLKSYRENAHCSYNG
jgi:GT2 family glycosyltransferase